MKEELRYFVVKTTYNGHVPARDLEAWTALPSCELLTGQELSMEEAVALSKLLNGWQNFPST